MGATAHTWRPGRFMVIAAHPDDADFGPCRDGRRLDRRRFGRLARLLHERRPGRRGSRPRPAGAGAAAGGRAGEAARIVGYAGVTFLHQPDGALANDLPLREHLVRAIRTFRPDAVLTHDPDVVVYGGGGINHTDHRAAGIAAIDAVYPAARNPMAFPYLARSGLAAHKVRRIYLFWPNQADTWVDTSATIDRKVRALQAHASQIRHPEELEERMVKWAAESGEPIGAAAADAFRLVVIDDDEEEGPTAETEAPTEAG